MNDQARPYVGDEVRMGIMGDDVAILIADVLEDQPLVDTDSAFIISDQYGDEHIIELDGDEWSTITDDHLSAEGQQAWFDRIEARHSSL